MIIETSINLKNKNKDELIMYIEEALSIIQKQEKIIEMMANEIYIEHNPHFATTEEVIEYFKKEVENENTN